MIREQNFLMEKAMHKCPHCGEKVISTFKKLMPGWGPRCPECGGKWRNSYFVALLILAMPFLGGALMMALAIGGVAMISPFLSLLIVAFVIMFLLYAMPLVKK